MLKVSSPKSANSVRCTPNLLPCRIHHNGPVDASQRYWAPEASTDGKSEAYFRGRKLKGKELKIPEGYKGLVVKETKEQRESKRNLREQQMEDDDLEREDKEESRSLQAVSSFDEVMLWAHESAVADDDAFVKGIGEWIQFAEVMNKPGQSSGG